MPPILDFECLYVFGPTGTGKTRWSLAHFDNPLLVTNLECLKNLTEDHDGIVFDDMSFRGMDFHECLNLLDFELPRTINVKYGAATIPARTRRIITYNLPIRDCLPRIPEEQFAALARRISCVQVDQKLYAPRNPTYEYAPDNSADTTRMVSLDSEEAFHCPECDKDFCGKCITNTPELTPTQPISYAEREAALGS